ncbi:MAG TPA: GFA family protein [Steroidobacteraceae bacterium]|nr:GFA family protein [Steroidobacteraceae bacterium]
MTHLGSCHCGRIAFEVDGDITQVMQCNCSHCSRKGFLLWFAPRAALRLKNPESAMSQYTFNKHAIRHQFCPVCGCAPLAFGTDRSGAAIAGVNVRCLPDVDAAGLQVKQVDGRSL